MQRRHGVALAPRLDFDRETIRRNGAGLLPGAVEGVARIKVEHLDDLIAFADVSMDEDGRASNPQVGYRIVDPERFFRF